MATAIRLHTPASTPLTSPLLHPTANWRTISYTHTGTTPTRMTTKASVKAGLTAAYSRALPLSLARYHTHCRGLVISPMRTAASAAGPAWWVCMMEV